MSKGLNYSTSIDSSGWTKGIDAAFKEFEAFDAKASASLASLKISAPQIDGSSFGGGVKGAEQASESISGAFLPLASNLQASLGSALRPLTAFAGKLQAEFEELGGPVKELAIRIDAAMRLPSFRKKVDGIKSAINSLTFAAKKEIVDLVEAVSTAKVNTAPLVASFEKTRQEIKKAVAPIKGDIGYALESAFHVDARAAAAPFLASLLEVESDAISAMKARADSIANAKGKGSRKARWTARDRAADLASAHAQVPPRQNATAATRAPDLSKLFDPSKPKGLEGAMGELGKAIGRLKARGDALGQSQFWRAISVGTELHGGGVIMATLSGIGVAAKGAVNAFVGFKRAEASLASLRSVAWATLKSAGKLGVPKLSFDPKQSEILKGIGGAAERTGSSLKSMGSQALAAFGVFGLVYKAVGFIQDGIKAASGLNETVNKTDAIFGDASKGVKGFADDLANKFGIVKQETLDVASGFGGLYKGIGGQSGAALAASAQDMTKLAADLSSFANLSFGEAGKALRTALSGNESDVLKGLGVATDEASVKAYAYSHNIAKVGAELSNQQKVAARSGLIMEGLADAQGDLDKTSGSTANQFRKLSGNVMNFGAQIGSALLPAVDAALSVLNKLAEWANRAFAGMGASVAQFIGPITYAFDLIQAAIENPKAAFEVFRLKALEVLLNIGEYLDVLPQNFSIVTEYLSNNWSKLVKDLASMWLTWVTNSVANIQELGRAIGAFLSDPTKGFEFNFKPLLDGFKATADKFPELVKPALTSMSKEIAAAAQPLLDSVQAKADRAKKQAEDAANAAASKASKEDPAAKGEKEIQKFAKDLTKSTRTPLEVFREQVGKIKEAMTAKLIDPTTAARGLAQAQQELQGKPQLAAAVDTNSSEGYSAIVQAMSGRANNGLQKAADRQAALQGDGNGILRRIESALAAKPAPVQVAI